MQTMLPLTKTFEIDNTLVYRLTGPTDFLFQIHALHGMDQEVLNERLEVFPPVPLHVYADPVINHRFLRLRGQAGDMTLHYQATVRRTMQAPDLNAPEIAVAEVPDNLIHNLMPTRYCESDRLGHAAIKMFGNLMPGIGRVQAIADWIHANVDYQPGSTQASTTACDVFLQRAGVCRDFAHLGVTFCRAINIPARLVVGYSDFAEPPPDFHAVFEAYVGHQWVLFDATRMAPLDGLVRIATGRDAKDVAFATIFGPASMVSMNPLIKTIG
jgi:transglutaminase-like putative cysteine protease